MTPNYDPPEHPEDRSQRLRHEAYGRTRAKAFVDDHRRDVVRLIEAYDDDEAADLLKRLRELFWAELWTPAVESQEGAPSAQAPPDAGPALGAGDGVPSWDSAELAAIRRRINGASGGDVDARALLRMLDNVLESYAVAIKVGISQTRELKELRTRLGGAESLLAEADELLHDAHRLLAKGGHWLGLAVDRAEAVEKERDEARDIVRDIRGLIDDQRFPHATDMAREAVTRWGPSAAWEQKRARKEPSP